MGWGSIISGALSIGGQLLQHKAQKDQAKETEKAAKQEAEGTYEASLAQKQELYQQAQDLEEMARRQSVAASVRSYQIQRAGQETASAAIQNYVGSGVVAGEGSAGLVPAHIVGTAAEDVFTNIMNANDQIFQIQSQAAANRRQGDVKEAAGLLAKQTGTAAAAAAANSMNAANWGSTLLGVSNTASGWFK
ncbi:hypothetical protein [Enterobacter bugandensis]|uniref:hypothetical protein n=1 Tax=Enterobacter bugandensis TaxID=881260 RepID=UPI0020055848|nr:hypothetical protein [Enterobacter bugandensis]MCK7435900.1 hypothetical protein [Enterobacter bugandensis]